MGSSSLDYSQLVRVEGNANVYAYEQAVRMILLPGMALNLYVGGCDDDHDDALGGVVVRRNASGDKGVRSLGQRKQSRWLWSLVVQGETCSCYDQTNGLAFVRQYL
jgi:hypothetical protein